MAEPGRRQGWSVPQRTAMVVAGALLAFLVGMLLLAGSFYRRDLEPRHRQPVTTFPAPGVETEIHDGTEDPTRPPVSRRPDPAIEAAKQAVVQDGIPGWGAMR